MESLERTVCHAAQRMLNRLQRHQMRTQLPHMKTPSRIRHFHAAQAIQAEPNTAPSTQPKTGSSGRDILARMIDETASMKSSRTERKPENLRANMDLLTRRNTSSDEETNPDALGNLLSLIGKKDAQIGKPTVTVDPLELKPADMRLKPSSGRTVYVNASRGRDVAGALRILQSVCNRNRVAADFNRQRFHERPGLKRKRLVSERWQRRFKQGFQAMVARATQIRKMGY